MTYFTHLHLHTLYSVLDGACKIPALVKKAQEYGMDAMALTDHGNMYGAMEFVTACNKAGIKPIVGCEVYVAPKSRFEKTGKDEKSSYHLILLAKNLKGYHNLVKMCSLSQRKEAYYYRPRIDHALLEQYHEGVIACSACLGGEIPQAIMSGQEEQLRENIEFYKRIFGEDYYLEVQRHGHPEQDMVNTRIEQLSKEYGIKCIASNDVHFVEADDYQAHRILICLNTGKKLSQDTKMVYTGQEYFKSGDEMADLFQDHPEYLENTREITEKVEQYKITNDILLPKFELPAPFTNEMEYLRHITYEGAKKRYGEDFESQEKIKERVDFELSTIERMGFPGYFLIVWDFIRHAREIGVLVGPGRGSAAGSAIAYCIGITNVDPIKYDLLFERFLNPGRISMPDIDVDFDDAGREKVIKYVIDKYGSERVSQIITYGSMAAKSAIKDVARVLDLPLPEANRLAKLVPDNPGMTLDKAFKEVPQLQEEMDNSENELVRNTLRYARKLEGCIRSVGVHACGMIIAPEDIIEYVPTSVAKDSEMPVTQYEGKYVESAGLLKMDFLGLRTLTIIKDALENIKFRHGIDVDIDHIPLDDEATYALFGRGETNGIFQFESDGMKKYLRELKPNRLEDIIAMNALYRPGPMEYIPKFINRKFGKEKIEYDLDDMEEYLAGTYGVCVYQEQVMLLSQKLADFTKADADTLRKAMGKKQIDVLEKMESKFKEGCAKHGYDLKVCEKIWNDWKSFASYAFNKSHSTCYAWLAYQTAYLKAHYPAEFMASVLTNNLSDITKISFFMDECKRMKIELLGPDVNESVSKFTVNKDGAIRFGMGGIKNVGTQVVEDIVNERNAHGKYTDILDFMRRSNLKGMNRRCMESLAQAGAFDSLGDHPRSIYFYQKPGENISFIEKLIMYAQNYQRSQNSAQVDLFGGEMTQNQEDVIDFPKVEPWTTIQQLSKEKEVVGFYISGHPLDAYSFELEKFATVNIAYLNNEFDKLKGKKLSFGAVITAAFSGVDKNGNGYGRCTIEDYEASRELMLFKDDYMKFGHFLKPGAFVFIEAEVQNRFRHSDDLELKVKSITSLSNVLDSRTRQIVLSMNLSEITPEYKVQLRHLLDTFRLDENQDDKEAANGKAGHPSSAPSGIPSGKIPSRGTADLFFEIHDPVNDLVLNMALAEKVLPSEFLEEHRKWDKEVEIKVS